MAGARAVTASVWSYGRYKVQEMVDHAGFALTFPVIRTLTVR
jgi:hypothetical protein